MEWLSSIRTAIEYMEEHLTDDISAQDVAARVHFSPFFLQKGFSLMTGYGIGEYIRNRRLYQAARDLKETDDKVIDIAFRYGYETPESFTKAFSRFHGATPSQVRGGAAINTFLPLTIKLSIQGGNQMDYSRYCPKACGDSSIDDENRSRKGLKCTEIKGFRGLPPKTGGGPESLSDFLTIYPAHRKCRNARLRVRYLRGEAIG